VSEAGDPKASIGGRLLVVLTALGLFGVPVWAILTAGLIQVFPEFVGYVPHEEILQIDGGSVVVQTDARPSLAVWTYAGTLSAVLVAVLLALMSTLGFFGRIASLDRLQTRRDLQRYGDIAGDVVLEGAEMRTRSASRTAVASPADAAPSDEGPPEPTPSFPLDDTAQEPPSER